MKRYYLMVTLVFNKSTITKIMRGSVLGFNTVTSLPGDVYDNSADAEWVCSVLDSPSAVETFVGEVMRRHCLPMPKCPHATWVYSDDCAQAAKLLDEAATKLGFHVVTRTGRDLAKIVIEKTPPVSLRNGWEDPTWVG